MTTATVTTGLLTEWKSQQQGAQYPWGWPEASFKESISLLKRNSEGEYEVTYENISKANRYLKPNAIDEKTNLPYHIQIYSSEPYISSPKDPDALTCVQKKTLKELNNMDFGIKQKGPMYYNSDNEKKYTLQAHLKDKGPLGVKDLEEVKKLSVHGLGTNTTAVNEAGVAKVGKGPKFYNRGNNGCINAIITRYDAYGNVQMMAMIRPQGADSDPGDFQMSAGCIFFAEEMTFNGVTIPRMSPTPFLVTSEEDNVKKSGALTGKGLAYARAAVYSKLFHGDEFKEMLDTWEFDKIAMGLVDDTSNTTESWVETSYNVHHITGYETAEELSKLSFAKVNKQRANVGFGVWRSIDPQPADPSNVYSQFYVEDGDDYNVEEVKHKGSAVKYDAFAEFDLWHGDHSFVAKMVADYVKDKYEFIEAVGNGSTFGTSKRIVK